MLFRKFFQTEKKIFKKANFYLFEPNPYIKLNDFKHNCLGISDNTNKTYYFNSFFPSSGSGFNKNIMNDFSIIYPENKYFLVYL